MGILDVIDKIEDNNINENNNSNGLNSNGGSRNVNINNNDFYYSKDMENISVRSIRPKTFLYTSVIKNYLGEKAMAILKILLSKERVTLKMLYSLMNNTDVPMELPTVKRTLVSMIQLGLINYYQDEIPKNFNPKINKKFKQKIHYSLNEEGLNLLLYSGEIITNVAMIHSYMGESPMNIIEEIITNCLQFGFLSIDQIVMTIKNDENEHFANEDTIRQCIDILLKDGWLVRATPLDQCPSRDLWNLIYNREYTIIGEKDKTLSELKRKHQATFKSKEKFNKLSAYSQGEICKVSLDRYWKWKRVLHISQLCESIHGITIGKILNFCGDIIGNKQPTLRDPLKECGLFDDPAELNAFKEEQEYKDENTPGVSFDALDIQRFIQMRNIPIDLNSVLVNKINSGNTNNNDDNKRVKKESNLGLSLNDIQEEDGEEGEEIDLDEAEIGDDTNENGKRSIGNNNASIASINACLQLLSDDMQSIQFLKKTSSGKYYFPFTKLTEALKESVYDGLIESTLGVSSLRLLRCIRFNRLITEKTLCSLVLLKDKDVRHIITKLIKINAVEIQELPKANDRSAARTVFLYKVDERHQYQYMEDNLCWNMANLINKIELLKEKNKVLLNKVERDDVAGKEEELLLTSELNQLKMINEREMSSFVRLNRLLSLWEVFQF
ncbi:hypothetical protein HANVADRAFT_51544 [Hanseniaspora valbyensis NRRL Y-1626]|uniref:DNA-directed RNA polymerase III subunit RPC3 n=1 Tax=Hanseniaspora valbyensis NRRL Y-1626 TaxID=766949 RepID=A0A1B7THJ2_9ASCO|nr:hypothetical protein HANVADRAFT_51544 [Hanseniaspora valbyensis NRRL Y-1626]